MSDDSDGADLAYQYEDLWYTKVAGPDTKVPPEGWEWGGYSQSFVAADKVMTHDEIVESDHDHWGIVGTQGFDNDHGQLTTLIFDLDLHKAPDDFDADDVAVPESWPLVKSQNGGFHVPTLVHGNRGALQESDFEMTADLGWDIDIRGSAVQMHVVAPTEIPGNETDYELVRDGEIPAFFEPSDACSRITYQGDPLLEYSPDDGAARGGDYSVDRDVEPPGEMPTCYHRGLQLRAASPDDPNVNTHKVNVLTALCGLAAGYDIETMVDHFCEQFPPDNPDPENSAYHLQHIADKMDRGEYSPPALSTLRDYGILDEDETCHCGIEYHGQNTPELFVDWDEVDRGEAIMRASTAPTDPHGELQHQAGHYGYDWAKTDESGNVVASGFDTVTNFTLELETRLDTYEGEILKIAVHPESPMEDSYEVQVHPTVFNEPRTFREEVVRGRTTYFDPRSSEHSAQRVLVDLRQTVGKQMVPQRSGTEFIGMHDDEWVTPEGTLTADGWDEDAEHAYYEKSSDNTADLESSSVGNKIELSPENDRDIDEDELADLLEVLPWTRKPSRGLPVLGWFYAAPLKPLIQDEEGQFNLLQVAGGTGTGKTSTLEMFYELFGAAPSPFSCDDTRFTIEKRLSSSCGFPIWLDEFKPTDMDESHKKWLYQKFREVFRGASTSKGRPSLGEVLFHFRAPVVFSGEQTVSKPAVRRRTIITQFSSASTREEYERAYCQVVGASHETDEGEMETFEGFDLQSHALAYYQYILEQPDAVLRDRWRAAKHDLADLVRHMGLGSLDRSEKQGLQTIIFGFRMFAEFAEEMGADPAALPDEDALREALEHVAMNIGPDGRRRQHIDDFTELLARASAAGYIEQGHHYKLVSTRKYDAETALAFHMPSCFPAVKKYMREYNVESEYSMLGRGDYVDNYGDRAEEPSSYPLATSHRVKDLDAGSKTVLLDADRAEESLGASFSLSSFIKTEADEPSDEDTIEEEATALDEIDAEAQAGEYTSVTAEVEMDLKNSGLSEDNRPVLKAYAEDETGQATVVTWDEHNDAQQPGAPLSAWPELESEDATPVYITNARVDDYDGTLQLVLERGKTGVQPVTAGVGHIPMEDPPDGQESLDAAADGGVADIESIKPRVVDAVRRLEDEHPEGVDRETLRQHIDDDSGTIEHGIDAALEDGRIHEVAEDTYRAT